MMINPGQGSAKSPEPSSRDSHSAGTSTGVSRCVPSTSTLPTSTTSLPIALAIVENQVDDIPCSSLMGVSNLEASSYFGPAGCKQDHYKSVSEIQPPSHVNSKVMSLLMQRPAEASFDHLAHLGRCSLPDDRWQVAESGKSKGSIGSMARKSLRRKPAGNGENPMKKQQKYVKAQVQQGHQQGGSQLLSLLTAPKAEIPGLNRRKTVYNQESQPQLDTRKQAQLQELPSVFMNEDYTVLPNVPATSTIPTLPVNDHTIKEALIDQDSVAPNWNSKKMSPFHSATNESGPKRARLMESGSGFSCQMSQGTETLELRQKRFLRTREALEKSGLMGITMKTADLIHKNEVLDQEINQLKKDMQHFLKMMLHQPQNQNMQGLIIAKCASLLMSNKAKPS